MTVDTKVIGNPNLLPNQNQTIQIINNIYPAPTSEGGYKPGKLLYYAAEGTVHYHMLTRCIVDEVGKSISAPIYRTTYAVAFTAGAVFGLYKAMKGDKHNGLEERATAFIDGDVTKKAFMASELFLAGGFPGLAIAESIPVGPGLGGLLAAGWAFSLGSDLSRLVYHKLHSSHIKE